MLLDPPGGHDPTAVLALADDLSGAAETAVALLLPGRIVLGPGDAAPPPAGEALVLDLDTRQLPGDEAARVVRTALRDVPAGTVLIKKTDSLLRGNLAAEALAYAEGAEGLVIAPALPAAGRTVRDGVVHLHGTPLHTTDAWRAEPRPAPRSVAEALGPLATAPVPLAVVRGSGDDLTERLRRLLAAGTHPVCDAETDADLDAIAAAALRLGPGVRLLGTGGLAAALGRLVGRAEGRPDDVPGPRPDETSPYGADAASPDAGRTVSERVGTDRRRDAPDRPLLVVVGTAEPGAVAQIAQLTAAGARHTVLSPELLARPGETPPLATERAGVTVVSIDGAEGIRHGAARRTAAGLGRAVAALAHPTDLVLTGGETARRVLDALGIGELRPVGQIHHGAVHSRTPDGRSVVTRPGSYGDTWSLLRIARALRPGHGPLMASRAPADPVAGTATAERAATVTADPATTTPAGPAATPAADPAVSPAADPAGTTTNPAPAPFAPHPAPQGEVL
ncbi:four-carbon acid sugar kinase family protein [Streptomyces sp. NPDC095613]|uniref:four-carbon acid sugar kinase family protein n=1 Tax=Streptomyces sp. NPDC095613 TaxID=3155540 RepID=UPI0033215840